MADVGDSLLDTFRLDDRVAVVTGAGRGIGRAIAWGLADAGAHLVINARREADLAETAAGITERGREVVMVPGDVREVTDRIAEESVSRFGTIDVWVNNVGGSDDPTTRALIDTPDEVFRSQLELNLVAAFQGCRAAARVMTDPDRVASRGEGVIVNISSGAGTRGSPYTGPYAAAKAGMNNLTQTLALELAPHVRVNAVAPGPVPTEAFDRVLNVEDQHEQLVASIPLGRVGRPDDIASAVLYFASPASSWITGQLLLVAGGRTQRTVDYRPRV